LELYGASTADGLRCLDCVVPCVFVWVVLREEYVRDLLTLHTTIPLDGLRQLGVGLCLSVVTHTVILTGVVDGGERYGCKGDEDC